MNRTHEDWANALLEDCSDENLLLWCDWLLYDADDFDAANGVRELLAKEGKRPFDNVRSFGWARNGPRPKCLLPHAVFNAIPRTPGYVLWRWYRKKELTPALAHYTALLDAASAWVRVERERKKQLQTKGT